MAFNINDFSSEVNAGGGVMRDNLFEFIIPIGPNFVSRYWADGVNFPGKINTTHDVRRYGYGIVEKRPFVTNFMQIEASFHNDNNNRVWGFLHQWMQLVLPHNLSGPNKTGPNTDPTDMLVNYKRNYQHDLYIHVYDTEGDKRSCIQVVKAFPSQLSSVPLSWNNRNSAFQFTCTFDFLAWNVQDSDGDIPYTGGDTTPIPAPLG